MPYESSFFRSGELFQRFEIQEIGGAAELVHVDVSGIERSKVLEEVGALAGIHPEVLQ